MAEQGNDKPGQDCQGNKDETRLDDGEGLLLEMARHPGVEKGERDSRGQERESFKLVP